MKVDTIMLIVILVICFVLLSCTTKNNEINELSDIVNHNIGVPTGTIIARSVSSVFPEAKFTYYDSFLDAALDVKNGKINVMACDEPILRNIVAKNPGLKILGEMITFDDYCLAVKLENYELKANIDKTIEFLKKSGLYDDMLRRWLPSTGNPSRMPELNTKQENGILRFGTSPITEPFSFIDDQEKHAGFNVELAYYVAMQMGMSLEIVELPFNDLITAIEEDRVDMIGSCLTYSEERAARILFSESYYPGGIAALVRE